MVEYLKSKNSSETTYSTYNFIKLLSAFSLAKDDKQIIHCLSQLAEFLSYGERHGLNYFDEIVRHDILEIFFPNFLWLNDSKAIYISLVQTTSILI